MTAPAESSLDELLGAYALDAVEPHERELLDQHLARSPRARAELEAHRSVASLLAHSGEEAPIGIWREISQQLGGDAASTSVGRSALRAGQQNGVVPPTGLWRSIEGSLGQNDGRGVTTPAERAPSDPASTPPPVSIGRRRWLRPLAGAAAAAALVLGGVAIGSRLGESPVQGTLDVDGRDFAMRSVDSGSGQPALLEVEVDSDGVATMHGSDLSVLDPESTYQLWAETPAGGLISVAVLGHEPATWTFPLSPETVGLHLTIESDPHGVVASEASPVMSTAA